VYVCRGILNSLGLFSHNELGTSAAAGMMFIIGVLFGIAAAVNMVILMKVTATSRVSVPVTFCETVSHR